MLHVKTNLTSHCLKVNNCLYMLMIYSSKTVSAPPTLVVSPNASFVASGSSISLTCTTTPTLGNLSYRFLLNGFGLQQGPDDTYLIGASTAADSGSYKCVATIDSRVSTTSGSHTVTVVGEWRNHDELINKGLLSLLLN